MTDEQQELLDTLMGIYHLAHSLGFDIVTGFDGASATIQNEAVEEQKRKAIAKFTKTDYAPSSLYILQEEMVKIASLGILCGGMLKWDHCENQAHGLEEWQLGKAIEKVMVHAGLELDWDEYWEEYNA